MTSIMVFMIIGAYLLGSISSAIVVTKIFIEQDIRAQGSGNPGTTNVLRVAGKVPALLVLVFDILKGALPVYIGFHLGLEPLALSLIAISACMGHIFPIFFNFKGGKGVATAIGAIMPIDWWLMACLLGTWLGVFLLTRISSLAAIVSLLTAPIYTYYFKPEFALAVLMLCIIILVKHKDNIKRLISRQEGRIK